MPVYVRIHVTRINQFGDKGHEAVQQSGDQRTDRRGPGGYVHGRTLRAFLVGGGVPKSNRYGPHGLGASPL